MKFGTQLATFVGGIQSEPKVDTHIKNWIDSNTLFVDQRYVWRIGITTAENILLIESKIRQDLHCKHWKYWRADNFSEAMEMMREFNKHPYVFKSALNDYMGKGSFLFVYKTLIPSKSLFFHTLRS